MEKAWIALREEEVEAAFIAPELRVRPVDERVPAPMRGTALGVIFERLARMNDGERHTRLRALIESTLMQWNLNDVRRIARTAAARLPIGDIAAYTIATLIGLRDPERLLPLIADFANAIAAGASVEAIARGVAATQPLVAAMPCDLEPDEAANLLGLLFQTHAATAKLIENRLAGRTDAPVAATRRFASEDVDVCGAQIKRGESVVLLLSSPKFQFGAGRHACPGRRIAEAIAEAAESVLVSRDADRKGA